MNFKSLKTQFIGAIAMVLVAAIAMGSSTYAWFAMNTQVSATGMTIQAKSEGGIVITNETLNTWDNTVAASHTGVFTSNGETSYLAVLPTSTSDVTNWYHNKSQQFDNAAAYQETATYDTLSTVVVDGVGFVDSNNTGANENVYNDDENAYYLLNKFYIKSSSADPIVSANSAPVLYINKIQVSQDNQTGDLNKALRVAVKVGTSLFIYAPKYATSAPTYHVAGATATTSSIAVPTTYIVNDAIPASTVSSIPGNTAVRNPGEGQTGAVEASVYVYFEGEDENCKSSNLKAVLDTLNVSVYFGTATVNS